MRPNLFVFDDVFSDFGTIRSMAAEAHFGDYQSPIDGRTYHDVFLFGPEGQIGWSQVASSLTGMPLLCGLSGLRRNSTSKTEKEGAIHCDLGFGDYASVLFVSDAPSDCSQAGTAFWRHKATGLEYCPENNVPEEVFRDYSNPAAWEMTGFVGAKPNRLLVYPTLRFHSRMPLGGYDGGDMGARVVGVAFYSLQLPDDTKSDDGKPA